MKTIIRSVFISFAIVFSMVAITPEPGLCDYKISMLPKLSAEETNRRLTLLAQYLTETTGLTITPVVSKSFAQYQQQLQSGAISIGFSNPYIYVLVSNTHKVVAKAERGAGKAYFRGIIITRSDSPLQTLNDLRGKRVSFVSRSAAGGFLSQKLTLTEEGIDVDRDLRLDVAVENKHENVIFAVFLGDADAGFIRESSFILADKFIPPGSLRILAKTARLPNWALSVDRSLPDNDIMKITEAILNLYPDSQTAKALGINRFVPAIDRDYDSVRKAAGLEIIDTGNAVMDKRYKPLSNEDDASNNR